MNYKSIEDFLSKIDENTLTTIFITIVIFFLGYVFSWISKAIASFLARRRDKNITKLALLNLVRQINKQAVHLKNFSEGLELAGPNVSSFDYVILYDLEIINSLSYISLRDAFLAGPENVFGKSLSLKEFNTLVNSIKYLNETAKPIIEAAQQVSEKFAELNELRNIELTEIQKNVEGFRINNVGKFTTAQPLGAYFMRREDIIHEWREQADYMSPTKVQTYLDNLLQLNRDNVKLISENEQLIDSVTLNIHINLATMRFENMVNFIESQKQQFKFYSDQLFINKLRLLAVYKKSSNIIIHF